MNTGAIIAAKQNRMMRKFEEHGATRAECAQTLDELEISDGFLFRRLVAAGVFRDAGNGRFYIDPERAEIFRARRRAIVLTAVFLSVALLALIFLLRG